MAPAYYVGYGSMLSGRIISRSRSRSRTSSSRLLALTSSTRSSSSIIARQSLQVTAQQWPQQLQQLQQQQQQQWPQHVYDDHNHHYNDYYYQFTSIRTKNTKATKNFNNDNKHHKKKNIKSSKNKNRNKKSKSNHHPASSSTSSSSSSSSSGRVTVYQAGGRGGSGTRTKAGSVKLCTGCGCRIVSGDKGETHMLGGSEAVDDSLSKKQAKLNRYLDVTETIHNNKSTSSSNKKKNGSSSSSSSSNNGNILCERCKALQNSNIWKAYDALRDVEPDVFKNQLKFVVQRRKFGMGIVVLDSTDSEHTMVRAIRKSVGKIPLVIVWNKIDLLPRFSQYDQRTMEQSMKRCGIQFVASFAVSAKTGHGTIDLAEYILQNLGGRDVFVLGAANVGKSTLVKSLATQISQSIYLRGKSKQVNQRRDQTSNQLQVTGSHLPGTTLQAVRIPCFASNRHALWDTPGIINGRAVQYSIFPAHLMEPLTRPGKIEVPTRENGKTGPLRPGQSILIESTWMGCNHRNGKGEEGMVYDEEDQRHQDVEVKEEEECVFARIDLIEIDQYDHGDRRRMQDSVFVQAYIHPSLRVRIVNTKDAPETATIPPSHIQRIETKIKSATQQKQTGLQEEYSKALLPYTSPDRPNGEIRPTEKERGQNGKHYLDIVFASLGWIALCHEPNFTAIPYCVDGSVYSKRRSIYPFGMLPLEETEEEDHFGDTEQVLEIQKRRLRDASRAGRHNSNHRRRDKYDDDDIEWWY